MMGMSLLLQEGISKHVWSARMLCIGCLTTHLHSLIVMYMCAWVQEGISNMFEQAGCGTPAVRSLLGEEGVSEGNMMQYLGILEQRTNEILQVSVSIGVSVTTSVQCQYPCQYQCQHQCQYQYQGQY